MNIIKSESFTLVFVGLEVRQRLSDVGLEVGVYEGEVGIFVGLVEWGHEDRWLYI